MQGNTLFVVATVRVLPPLLPVLVLLPPPDFRAYLSFLLASKCENRDGDFDLGVLGLLGASPDDFLGELDLFFLGFSIGFLDDSDDECSIIL